MCLALALWNGRDPILKERLFGLTGHEGNHGEDVKEYYFYLDSTPTHSYMRMLYKYPQAAFPYDRLVEENRRRGRDAPEFELIDTGVFDDDRYFDVFVEYAKADAEDLLMRITVANRGPEAAPLHVLPTVWFRNTWSWDARRGAAGPRAATPDDGAAVSPLQTRRYGRRVVSFAQRRRRELLFTENETNATRLFGVGRRRRVLSRTASTTTSCTGATRRVNPARHRHQGGRALRADGPGRRHGHVARALLADAIVADRRSARTFDAVIASVGREADEFYASVIPDDAERRRAVRDAPEPRRHAVVEAVLPLRREATGSTAIPAQPPPPAERQHGRNHEWTHLYNADVISMPDKWEYPWYAAWDLAFHCVPLALVDSEFAKEQLVLMLREWYMHPNGQLPAYEWAFGDVNPPVHAWAAWRVYKIEKKRRGVGDRAVPRARLPQAAAQLHLVGQPQGRRGQQRLRGRLPRPRQHRRLRPHRRRCRPAAHCEQSDGTSWMAMYSLNLLAIAMELAHDNPAYEDVASKFWEHFLYIGHAMGHQGKDKDLDLWDEEDGFFYDVPAAAATATRFPLKVRSMVGLIPLFAVETLEPEMLERLPGFKRRLEWFIEHRPDLTDNVACMRTPGAGRAAAAVGRRLPSDCARAALHARRGRVPVAVRHPRAVARITATTRTCSESTAASIASTTSPANRAPGCSAATPTGAGRSGSR